MKKVKRGLSMIIASVMCVIVLFGHSSISSRAATTMNPATNLGFSGTWVHYSNQVPGYYTLLITCKEKSGKLHTIYHSRNNYESVPNTHSLTSTAIDHNYIYLGQVNFYVIGSISKMPVTYETIEDYKKDSNCVVSKPYTVNVTKKAPKPQVIKTKIVKKNGKKKYEITCKNDGYGRVAHTSGAGYSVGAGATSFMVDAKSCAYELEIRNMTNDMKTTANSDPIVIKLEAVENISDPDPGDPDEGEDPGPGNWDTPNPWPEGGEATNTNGGEGQAQPGTTNGGSGTSGTSGESESKDAPSVESNTGVSIELPMTVTEGGITYDIDVNGNAVARKIGNVKKVNINTVIAKGMTFPVTVISDGAAKGNKKLTSVTIGSNVTRIGKKAFYNCKKLKKVNIKPNTALKIEKGAFRKINKDAVIKAKGLRGKQNKLNIKK